MILKEVTQSIWERPYSKPVPSAIIETTVVGPYNGYQFAQSNLLDPFLNKPIAERGLMVKYDNVELWLWNGTPWVTNKDLVDAIASAGGKVKVHEGEGLASILDLRTALTYAVALPAASVKANSRWNYCMMGTEFHFSRKGVGWNKGGYRIFASPFREQKLSKIVSEIDEDYWNGVGVGSGWKASEAPGSSIRFPTVRRWYDQSFNQQPKYTLIVGVSISGGSILPISEVAPPGTKYPVSGPTSGSFEDVVDTSKLQQLPMNDHIGEVVSDNGPKGVDGNVSVRQFHLSFGTRDVVQIVGYVNFGTITFKSIVGYNNPPEIEGISMPLVDFLNGEAYVIENQNKAVWLNDDVRIFTVRQLTR